MKARPERTQTCETHHWISTNVPGLISRWVIQCSLCYSFNVDEMNRNHRIPVTQSMIDAAMTKGTESHDWGMFQGQVADLGEAVEEAIRTAISSLIGEL